MGTSLGLTGRASKLANPPSNPPTNQPTKTASCVRPGHQPAAGQILFTGTLDHQVVKAGLQPKKKKEAGKLINQLVRLSDQLINWPRYGCCCHKRENWIRPSKSCLASAAPTLFTQSIIKAFWLVLSFPLETRTSRDLGRL